MWICMAPVFMHCQFMMVYTCTLAHTHTQSSANVAVARLNNYDLGMKRISVAISNPPKGSKVTFNPAVDSDVITRKPGGVAERKTEFKAPTFAPRAILGNNPM